MINKQLINLSSPATSGGGGGNQEEGLILHLDANDVDSYDGDGDEWVDIANHEYTPSTDVSEHFNTVLYTGNAGTQDIDDVGFQPDFVWLKHRSGGSPAATNHYLYDSLRGFDKVLFSNLTLNEYTVTSHLSNFNDDGFTVGNDAAINATNGEYVAWCFKAGGAPSGSDKVSIDGTSYADEAAAGLTAGSAAVVNLSANTKLGFSIVETGTYGSSERSHSHGLGVKPELIMVKSINDSSDWFVWAEGFTNSQKLTLNSNAGKATHTSLWGTSDTTPHNSNDFTFYGSNGQEYIAYCFASKRGVSKVGSYNGIDSTDVKVNTGFEPAFLLIKNTNSTGGWVIYDNKRDASNPRAKWLRPHLNNAEVSYPGYYDINFDRDGFTAKGYPGGNDTTNNSGDSYIYYAVAKSTNETGLTPNRDDFTAGSVETTDLEVYLDANSYSGSGDWLDGTSNDNDGTITGASYVNDGSADYFSFNGSSNWVNTNYTPPNASGNFTVETWLYYTGTTAAKGVWSTYNNSGSDREGIGLVVSNGSPSVIVFDSAGVDSINASAITAGWHHFAVTYSGGLTKLYIDGQVEPNTVNQVITAHHGTIGIGLYYRSLTNSSNNWDGKIGQFRVYESVLTPTQIESNYEATRIYNTPDLKLHLDAASFPQKGEDNYNPTPSTWTDSSDNSYNGTISGATFDSELGNYLDFDGSNDKVSLGTASSIIPSGSNFTLECWVNPKSISDSTYWAVISAVQGTSPYGGYMLYFHHTTDHWGIAMNGGGTWVSKDTGVDVVANKWVHLAFTYDGSNMKLFVDGEDKYTFSQTSSLQYMNTPNLELGANQSNYAPIKLGQTRIYSSALTQAQIRQNYNYTKPNYPNGNDGTLVSMGSSEWNSNGYFTFDGASDYIELPFNTTFDEFSFHAWVRPDSTTGTYHGILGKWWDGSNRSFMLTGINQQLKVDIAYTDSNTDHVFGSTALPDATWSFVCATWKNYEGLTLTVNDTTETFSINKAIRSNTNSWYIGNQDSRVVKLWDGRISECKMYDKKLTSAEITEVYNANKSSYGL